ncbi:MAG: hypothetical protein ACRD1H_02475 [Vicinamibacterales bacterium]
MSMLLIGVFVTIAGMAVAVAGLIGVRRSVELSLLQDHHDVAGFFIGIIGVLYAVLLAFVVIVVWEDFNDASRTVDNEANELSDIYWLANGLDTANRDRVQEAVRSYAASVVDDEWPARSSQA